MNGGGGELNSRYLLEELTTQLEGKCQQTSLGSTNGKRIDDERDFVVAGLDSKYGKSRFEDSRSGNASELSSRSSSMTSLSSYDSSTSSFPYSSVSERGGAASPCPSFGSCASVKSVKQIQLTNSKKADKKPTDEQSRSCWSSMNDPLTPCDSETDDDSVVAESCPGDVSMDLGSSDEMLRTPSPARTVVGVYSHDSVTDGDKSSSSLKGRVISQAVFPHEQDETIATPLLRLKRVKTTKLKCSGCDAIFNVRDDGQQKIQINPLCWFCNKRQQSARNRANKKAAYQAKAKVSDAKVKSALAQIKKSDHPADVIDAKNKETHESKKEEKKRYSIKTESVVRKPVGQRPATQVSSVADTKTASRRKSIEASKDAISEIKEDEKRNDKKTFQPKSILKKTIHEQTPEKIEKPANADKSVKNVSSDENKTKRSDINQQEQNKKEDAKTENNEIQNNQEEKKKPETSKKHRKKDRNRKQKAAKNERSISHLNIDRNSRINRTPSPSHERSLSRLSSSSNISVNRSPSPHQERSSSRLSVDSNLSANRIPTPTPERSVSRLSIDLKSKINRTPSPNPSIHSSISSSHGYEIIDATMIPPPLVDNPDWTLDSRNWTPVFLDTDDKQRKKTMQQAGADQIRPSSSMQLNYPTSSDGYLSAYDVQRPRSSLERLETSHRSDSELVLEVPPPLVSAASEDLICADRKGAWSGREHSSSAQAAFVSTAATTRQDFDELPCQRQTTVYQQEHSSDKKFERTEEVRQVVRRHHSVIRRELHSDERRQQRQFCSKEIMPLRNNGKVVFISRTVPSNRSSLNVTRLSTSVDSKREGFVNEIPNKNILSEKTLQVNDEAAAAKKQTEKKTVQQQVFVPLVVSKKHYETSAVFNHESGCSSESSSKVFRISSAHPPILISEKAVAEQKKEDPPSSSEVSEAAKVVRLSSQTSIPRVVSEKRFESRTTETSVESRPSETASEDSKKSFTSVVSHQTTGENQKVSTVNASNVNEVASHISVEACSNEASTSQKQESIETVEENSNKSKIAVISSAKTPVQPPPPAAGVVDEVDVEKKTSQVAIEVPPGQKVTEDAPPPRIKENEAAVAATVEKEGEVKRSDEEHVVKMEKERSTKLVKIQKKTSQKDNESTCETTGSILLPVIRNLQHTEADRSSSPKKVTFSPNIQEGLVRPGNSKVAVITAPKPVKEVTDHKIQINQPKAKESEQNKTESAPKSIPTCEHDTKESNDSTKPQKPNQKQLKKEEQKKTEEEKKKSNKMVIIKTVTSRLLINQKTDEVKEEIVKNKNAAARSSMSSERQRTTSNLTKKHIPTKTAATEKQIQAAPVPPKRNESLNRISELEKKLEKIKSTLSMAQQQQQQQASANQDEVRPVSRTAVFSARRDANSDVQPSKNSTNVSSSVDEKQNAAAAPRAVSHFSRSKPEAPTRRKDSDNNDKLQSKQPQQTRSMSFAHVSKTPRPDVGRANNFPPPPPSSSIQRPATAANFTTSQGHHRQADSVRPLDVDPRRFPTFSNRRLCTPDISGREEVNHDGVSVRITRVKTPLPGGQVVISNKKNPSNERQYLE